MKRPLLFRTGKMALPPLLKARIQGQNRNLEEPEMIKQGEHYD